MCGRQGSSTVNLVTRLNTPDRLTAGHAEVLPPASISLPIKRWLRFDCNSTALRPFDDLYYDALLYCGLNQQTGSATAASVLRHCDLNDL